MRLLFVIIISFFYGCSDQIKVDIESLIFEFSREAISDKKQAQSGIEDYLLVSNKFMNGNFFSNSWISAIKTTKSFDKEVRVVIDEHQPIASLGRGRFLTQEGKIIFPKEKNKQLDLISITGEKQDITYLFGSALALQSVLNLRNYSLVSFSASDSGILTAVDSNGAKYSFNREDFRVQLERLEHFLLFELNSGSNDHIRYIDLRYKNAIAVRHDNMEESV